MAQPARFIKTRSGHYVQPESGIELVRGLDDGDIQWQVWTAHMGEPLGIAPTLNEAKKKARDLLDGKGACAHLVPRRGESPAHLHRLRLR